jgi:CubicO group peptidase (beta-lactamase class C family)
MTNLSRREAVLAAAALAACTPNQIAAATPSAEPEQLADIADAVVRPALAEEGIPGASFVAFDTQGRIATRHWGLADREANRAVSDETVWPIASITKTLTATAAMTLVDQRRVDLDADITTYLDDTRIPPFAGPPITLRRLLTHTSGFDEVRGRMCNHADAPERLADFLNRKLVRIRPAGQLTAYSSYAPTVVQQLIEDVAGGRYEDYVREAIFEPLGMRSARFVLRAPDLAGVAAPYDIDDGQATRRSEYEFYITTGASSACATAADMGRFGAALLRHGAGDRTRILSSRAASAMLRQQATVHPAVPGWGLGFQLDQVGGRWIAEHGGDIGGFASLFTLIPEAGIGFYTVHHGEGGSLRHRVRSAALASVAPETPQAPTPNAEAAARLREYAGRYRSTLEELSQPVDPETLFEVSAGEGTLQLWGQTWIPVGADLFVRDDGLRKLGFARDAEGRVMALTNGSWRVLLKV